MSNLSKNQHWYVIIGLIVGCFAGYLSGSVFPGSSTRWDMTLYGLFGGLFMSGLKMLIVPLVMSSIMSAMGSLGQQAGFARLGLKTIGFYTMTSFIAIIIGLTAVNLIAPGESTGISSAEIVSEVQKEGSEEMDKMKHLENRTSGRGLDSTLNVFRELVPTNIINAMAHQKMLGIIVFSLMFGFFINGLEEQKRNTMRQFIEGIQDVMIKMTFTVLKFLPLGVACLIAQTSAETFASGNVLERLSQLSKFAITVVIALGSHAFIVMPLLLILLGKVKPRRHFAAIQQALLTAFSTASSSATLPLTMDCIQQKAKVSKRVSSFVLPVGATVNMDGTALYECVAVMFLAQLSGIPLDASVQFTVVLLALLTSIGVAGIPSASLVAIVIILNAVNEQLGPGSEIPMEALAIILVFDRLLDMFRTAVNVLGDSVCSVVVARSEGEKQVLSSEV
jgi:DAACS family dicarboxylate/amino acid:cation (Na+ or H+) symporter